MGLKREVLLYALVAGFALVVGSSLLFVLLVVVFVLWLLGVESAGAALEFRSVAVIFGVVLGLNLAWNVANKVGKTLEDRVVAPLLRILADDKRIRQRSLAVGAVLFVVCVLLQLIATF